MPLSISLLTSRKPLPLAAPLMASVRSLDWCSSLPLWIGEPLEGSRAASASLKEKSDWPWVSLLSIAVGDCLFDESAMAA